MCKLTDDTADFRTVLVDGEIIVGEFRQRGTVLCDVEYVRKNVNVVNTVRVDGKYLPELDFGTGKIYGCNDPGLSPLLQKETARYDTVQIVEYVPS